jgi:hypothetical protein
MRCRCRRVRTSRSTPRAKDLVEAATATDPDAVAEWAARWRQALRSELGITYPPFALESFDRAVEGITTGVHTRRSSRPAPT